MREKIQNGDLQFSTGCETTADAGVCVLSGAPLYRHCVTRHVARVDHVRGERGDHGQPVYSITEADGRSSDFNIEARDRRAALLKWYENTVDSLRAEIADLRNEYSNAIDEAAIAAIDSALSSQPKVSWRGIPHYTFSGPWEARTNDYYRYAAMRGYCLQGVGQFSGTAHLWPAGGDKPESVPEEI